MKVSFDFDETLSEPEFQKIAAAFIEAGVTVYIITSRVDSRNTDGERCGNIDIWVIADYLKIPRERVLFTNGGFKAETVARERIDLHFDDMDDEIHVIKVLTQCHAVNLKFNDE